jgi:hypothetical protein
MTDRHTSPIPPRTNLTDAERTKRDCTRRVFFKDNVFPHDGKLAELFATISPTAHGEIVNALPSLLPSGPLTKEVADFITEIVGNIYDRLHSTKESAVPLADLAAVVRSMPCQHAAEAFLHAYKHLFQDMVGHPPCVKTGNTR